MPLISSLLDKSDRKRNLTTMALATEEEQMNKKAKRSNSVDDSSKAETADIRKEMTKETNGVETAEAPQVLPSPSTPNVSPDEYLKDLVFALCGYKPKMERALSLKDYFPEITDAQIAAYDMDMISAARENNVDKIKAFYAQGKQVDCCNRFGESLLHLACRRGFEEIGIFLLQEAALKVRIADDCGRTPFTDICWNHKPNLVLAKHILQRDPTLLLISDKRGHTPFQYARPQHWSLWRKFLFEQRDCLKECMDNEETKKIFG